MCYKLQHIYSIHITHLFELANENHGNEIHSRPLNLLLKDLLYLPENHFFYLTLFQVQNSTKNCEHYTVNVMLYKVDAPGIRSIAR